MWTYNWHLSLLWSNVSSLTSNNQFYHLVSEEKWRKIKEDNEEEKSFVSVITEKYQVNAFLKILSLVMVFIIVHLYQWASCSNGTPLIHKKWWRVRSWVQGPIGWVCNSCQSWKKIILHLFIYIESCSYIKVKLWKQYLHQLMVHWSGMRGWGDLKISPLPILTSDPKLA